MIDHDNEEVIDINKTAEAEPVEKEDRGDDFVPPGTEPELPSKEALDALLKSSKINEDAKPDKAPPELIPYSRFAERTAQFHDMRVRAEMAEQALAEKNAAPAKTAEPAIDLKAMEAQHRNALMEGDEDKAAELAEKIRNAIVDSAREQALVAVRAEFAKIEQEKTFKSEQQAYDKTIQDVFKRHPSLSPDDESHNAEALDDLATLTRGLVSKGIPRAEALSQALGKVEKMYGLTEAPTKTNDIEAMRLKREREANAKGAAAAGRQPAPLMGQGNRASTQSTLNVEEMTDEEFAALPMSEKKRLRGD